MNGEATATTADHALALALRTWDDADRILGALGPDLRQRVETVLSEKSVADPLARLRDDHASLARADLTRVHPSWLARALEGESYAVRATVLAELESRPGAPLLSSGTDTATAPVRPDPEIRRVVLGIWSERLVGGLEAWRARFPVVGVLAGPEGRDLSRLATLLNLAKQAADPESEPPASARSRERFQAARTEFGSLDPTLVALARTDRALHTGEFSRGLPWLGLITFARLLAAAEPSAARWALQHLPYRLARALRSTIKAEGGRAAGKAAKWEGELLAWARARLASERHPGGEP